ncbi:MAG: hypothetical protein NXI24_04905 [bacterium]|nr:hypothetical protein [bacterium]
MVISAALALPGVFGLCETAGTLNAETRSSDEVFKKWLTWQRVYEDVDLGDVDYLDEKAAGELAGSLPAAIRPQLKYLEPPASTQDRAALKGFAANLRETLAAFASPGDIEDWLAELAKPKTGFTSSAQNTAERESKFRKITAKYREFLEWISGAGEERAVEVRRFAIANRFFEYCFSPATHAQFRSFIDTPALRPIARMLYANIWYNLSGNGWRYWHADALAALRERSRAGGEIVYIAGGSDILLPIRNGIYNIRIIDPMFPSQTKYYSEGWEFLIRGRGPGGGRGDTIDFGGDGESGGIVMRRMSYREFGRFETGELSDGKKLTLPKSESVWELRDRKGAHLGRFTLERRFVSQADFHTRGKRSLLISFNELYYITASGSSGWGIDPRKFSDGVEIFVKQLRKPVDRAAMIHMRETNEADFYYIKLGTSVD